MAAVTAPPFALHAVVALDDAVGELRTPVGPPLPFEELLTHGDVEPESGLRVVADHQVAVGIDTRGSAAERLRAAAVGKYVIGVTVAFHDGQGRVERHPEDQVRQLAQPASDSRTESPAEKNDPVEIPLAACRMPDQPPIAERFAGAQNHAVEVCGGQAEVGDLIVLVLHVHVFQLAQKRRAVAKMQVGTPRSRGFPGEAQSAEIPRSIAQERVPKTAAPEAQPRTFQRSGRGLFHGQPSLAMNFARSTT